MNEIKKFKYTKYPQFSKQYNYKNKFLKKKKENQQIQNQKKGNQQIQKQYQADLTLFSKGVFFYIGNEDFNDLKEKVILWTVVGWVYDFVLWKKDNSHCLDQDLPVAFTYRTWLLSDGIASLVMFGLIVIALIIRLIRKSSMLIWKLEQQSIFVIQKKWIKNNIWLWNITILIILSKIAWIIAGIVIFWKYVDSNQQINKEKNCSGNVPNFLLLYFTQTIYVLIEGLTAIIKGKRIKRNMKQKYEQMNDPMAQANNVLTQSQRYLSSIQGDNNNL